MTSLPINCGKNFRAGKLRWIACLAAMLLISGCMPAAPAITVTIKPVEGEDGTDESADGPVTEVAGYGNFVGRITFDGNVPELAAIVNQGDGSVKDASVCSADTIPDESLLVDPATKGIANAVIFLAKTPRHVKPELATGELEPAVFDQKGCKFFPHVLPVRVDLKQQVVVKSGDPIAHNTHTFPNKNSGFNQAIRQNDREGVVVPYSRAEKEPIPVTCDYHSWMKAYHFPIDHPYFAVTGPDGSFRIEGLPAGKHVFKIWQERAGLLERKLEVEIKPDAEETADLVYGADKFQL